jgi:hypothetical protein
LTMPSPAWLFADMCLGRCAILPFGPVDFAITVYSSLLNCQTLISLIRSQTGVLTLVDLAGF